MAKTLKEIVASKSIVEGECRLWQGGMNSRNRPVALHEGKLVDLQLLLARKKFEISEGKKVSIATSCGNPRCINREHIVLVETKRPPRGVRSPRLKTKSTNGDLNMQVFSLLIRDTHQTVADKLSLSLNTVKAIVRNTAMYPFFQAKLESELGVKVAELRANLVDGIDLRADLKVSKFAEAYIRSEHNYSIKDFDVYSKLLKECAVMGEHLIWLGHYMGDETPTTTLFDGRQLSVVRWFRYAMVGGDLDRHQRRICECEKCVNPLHQE